MKVTLILTGKTKEDYISTGIQLYKNKLKHYISFSLLEIPDIKKIKEPSDQKKKEAVKILDYISDRDFVVLLDEKGKQMTSVQYAQQLQKWMNGGNNIVFIVGGAFGFDEMVYNRANALLSLSKMTFSHQMVRLFFVEQLYRGFSILRGEKYHHE